MRKFTSAFFLGIVPLAANGPVSARPHDHSPASARCSAPLELEMSGPRPALTITIADGRQFPAIFDTGAMNTSVNIDFAERLGLVNEGPLAPPYDKHSTGYQTSLKGARIGTLELPTRSVPVMPLPLPDKAAVLSPAAFSGQLVRLDLSKGTLQVCSKQALSLPAERAFAYTAKPFELPSIPLSIGDQVLQAHFDTGSPYEIILPLRFAKSIELIEPLQKAGTVRMHSGERPFYAARIKGGVRAGSITLENPKVGFSDLVPWPNVGMGLLRRLVVTIDPENKRSWIELPFAESDSRHGAK